MDEQTTATQASSYDVSADGIANAGYEEEPLQAMPEELTQPGNEEALAEDGIRLKRLYNELCKSKKYRRLV